MIYFNNWSLDTDVSHKSSHTWQVWTYSEYKIRRIRVATSYYKNSRSIQVLSVIRQIKGAWPINGQVQITGGLVVNFKKILAYLLPAQNLEQIIFGRFMVHINDQNRKSKR